MDQATATAMLATRMAAHSSLMNVSPGGLVDMLLLQDTDEGRNKSSDNPANPAQGTETSSGACIPARRMSISTDITSNSNQDGVSSNTHTEPTPSH